MEKKCILLFPSYLRVQHCKNVLAMLKRLGVRFEEPQLSKLEDGEDIAIEITVTDEEVMEILGDMSVCDYITLLE